MDTLHPPHAYSTYATTHALLPEESTQAVKLRLRASSGAQSSFILINRVRGGDFSTDVAPQSLPALPGSTQDVAVLGGSTPVQQDCEDSSGIIQNLDTHGLTSPSARYAACNAISNAKALKDKLHEAVTSKTDRAHILSGSVAAAVKTYVDGRTPLTVPSPTKQTTHSLAGYAYKLMTGTYWLFSTPTTNPFADKNHDCYFLDVVSREGDSTRFISVSDDAIHECIRKYAPQVSVKDNARYFLLFKRFYEDLNAYTVRFNARSVLKPGHIQVFRQGLINKLLDGSLEKRIDKVLDKYSTVLSNRYETTLNHVIEELNSDRINTSIHMNALIDRQVVLEKAYSSSEKELSACTASLVSYGETLRNQADSFKNYENDYNSLKEKSLLCSNKLSIVSHSLDAEKKSTSTLLVSHKTLQSSLSSCDAKLIEATSARWSLRWWIFIIGGSCIAVYVIIRLIELGIEKARAPKQPAPPVPVALQPNAPAELRGLALENEHLVARNRQYMDEVANLNRRLFRVVNTFSSKVAEIVISKIFLCTLLICASIGIHVQVSNHTAVVKLEQDKIKLEESKTKLEQSRVDLRKEELAYKKKNVFSRLFHSILDKCTYKGND